VGAADGAGRRLLLQGDVESLVFPAAIVQHIAASTIQTADDPAADINRALRQHYEGAVGALMETQGMELADCFGGEEEVEQFWAAPDREEEVAPLPAAEWIIPLEACERTATHQFDQQPVQ
jgi:hypothetical protein